MRVRRTRDAGSHRPQSPLHHRVHQRYRGIRYDLPERDAGRLVAGDLVPSFARNFYGRRLTCVWGEGGRDGHRNEIFQEEGGQQGDALMPLFISDNTLHARERGEQGTF